VLLGHFLLTQQPTDRALVLTTIVSSAQLKAIAQGLGVAYADTLTGFKWIANRALELEHEGLRFVFGYEEALGYTVGTVVRDKDGIGAALVMADLAAWCKGKGLTLFGYLEQVQRAHGLFVARQFNTTLPGSTGAATIKAVMQAFREQGVDRIGPLGVEATCDYQAQSRVCGGVTTPLALPKSNVLAWELAGGSRVTLRPSGTEPKLKVYFEVRESLAAGEPMAPARSRATQQLDALEAAFLALARTRGLP
jgi:phosphomannomutase